jgi:hypothetical protein
VHLMRAHRKRGMLGNSSLEQCMHLQLEELHLHARTAIELTKNATENVRTNWSLPRRAPPFAAGLNFLASFGK